VHETIVFDVAVLAAFRVRVVSPLKIGPYMYAWPP
jgi:hypothetical protein